MISQTDLTNNLRKNIINIIKILFSHVNFVHDNFFDLVIAPGGNNRDY